MVKNRFKLNPRVLKEFEYKVYYNPKLKMLGGQSTPQGGTFLPVSDLNMPLPVVVSGPNTFVKRRAKLIVYDEEVE